MGTFLDGVFVSGVSARLVDSCVDDRGVLIPVMETVSEDVHKRCAGQFPDQDDPQALLPDPYESRLVTTGPSSIPGANEGLHAVIPIEASTIVSFYHGQKVRPEDFDPDSWDGNCYKIFDPSDYPRGTIDIPLWAQVRINILNNIHLIQLFTFRMPRSTSQAQLTKQITVFSPTLSSLFLIIQGLDSFLA